MIYLHPELHSFFANQGTRLFDQMMALSGDAYRQQKGRLTQRVQIGTKFYFVKQYTGIGVKEILKDLFQGRLPIISAKNEWQAILKLQNLNVAVPRVLAYGRQGLNPAEMRSFVLLEALNDTISLEEVFKEWQKNPPNFTLKQYIISEVAKIARRMHQNGMNHRDFYICHFLIAKNYRTEKSPSIYLIDLHRAQLRSKIPRRWLIKDLAGLYFSSKGMGLTERDLFRFMQHYTGKTLKTLYQCDNQLWRNVKLRGEQLYRDHHS